MAKTIYADQLAHALDHCDAPIEALSLDCFDTLIWRTTPEPSDVFCDLVPKISRQARQVAEHTARERRKISHGNNEISLTDIYRCALPHGSEAEQRALIEAELAAEHQHCFAFGPCVALIRAAKQRGLKIIIVSDTYFSEAELRTLIAASGDIVCGEAPPGERGWAVEAAGKRLTLRHGAVSTSGDTRQFFERDGRRYSHIIDPRTGLPLTDHSLVTVIARDGITANTLLTGRFATERIDGSIRIADLGCGAIALLVLNGPQRGRIWLDFRGTFGGITPAAPADSAAETLSFLEWYEAWLDDESS